MGNLNSYMQVGICPTMLLPESFADPTVHRQAVRMGCDLKDYDALELYLCDDDDVAGEEIKILKDSGKVINYNSPGQFQLPGAYDAGSDDPAVRRNARAFAYKHLDYATQLGAKLFVVTSCPDVPEKRNIIRERFAEFTRDIASYAKERDIYLVIEPIERHRFKKLLLGPTDYVAEFIRDLRDQGVENLSLMLDAGHLPLMEESFEEALRISNEVGLKHVHLGDAMLDEKHPLYGHTHPPMCVRGGIFSMDIIVEQLVALIECGYLDENRKSIPRISFEVRSYEGVSAETSAKVHYERLTWAFEQALERRRRIEHVLRI